MIYDPTIFDNLKVVLEGGLYDLDRENRIKIQKREDLIDAASMGRRFRMEFSFADENEIMAVVELSTELADFAAELAKIRLVEAEKPGCKVNILFTYPDWKYEKRLFDPIASELKALWNDEVELHHKLTTHYESPVGLSEERADYSIRLEFPQKIDEQNMEDLEGLLHHTLLSMECIQQITGK